MPPVLGGRLSTALESKRSSTECYRTFQSDKSSGLVSKLQVSHTLWFAEVAALRHSPCLSQLFFLLKEVLEQIGTVR